MKGGMAEEAVLKGKSEGETPQDTFDPAVGFGGGVRSLVIGRREVLREAWHLRYFLFFRAYREGSFVCVEKGGAFRFLCVSYSIPREKVVSFSMHREMWYLNVESDALFMLELFMCAESNLCTVHRDVHFLCVEGDPFSVHGERSVFYAWKEVSFYAWRRMGFL